MAKKHGFMDYAASDYLTDEHNFYTGEVRPLWDSVNKQIALNYFTDKYYIDLSSSFAYGDTSGDFTMLKAVAHPIAMNPTKELISKLKTDPITRDKVGFVVERKDMIYQLNSNCINFSKF
jgi:phosphoserine phosphatase